MDYEKKYNEAMLRADEAVQKGCLDKDMFDIIFPPEESEDERIRKWIIEELEITRDAMSGKNPYSDDPDIVARLKRLDEAIAYLEKQEQKPVEKQDYSGLTNLERAIHRGFLVAGVENVPVTIIKETAKDCLAHMPTEWSEEDEKKIGRLRSVVNQLASYTDSLDVNGDYCEGDYAELDTWLKSLRPSWKPSEEQMDALNKARRFIPYNCDILESLYEQLKKL